jgi:hypothetical protein
VFQTPVNVRSTSLAVLKRLGLLWSRFSHKPLNSWTSCLALPRNSAWRSAAARLGPPGSVEKIQQAAGEIVKASEARLHVGE